MPRRSRPPRPATAAAPKPTETPTPAPKTGFTQVFSKQWNNFSSTVLAGLLLVLLAYLLARAIRWLWGQGRELFYLRLLPQLNRPAVKPSYFVGEFTNATSDPKFKGAGSWARQSPNSLSRGAKGCRTS